MLPFALVPSISISSQPSYAGELTTAPIDPQVELKSQRSLALPARSINSTACSPSPSQPEPASELRSSQTDSSIRMQRPQLVRTPTVLDLNLNLNLNLNLRTVLERARSRPAVGDRVARAVVGDVAHGCWWTWVRAL